MANTTESLEILKDLELPSSQQNEVSQYTLLALAYLGPTDSWKDADNKCIRIHDIIEFLDEKHGKKYAENSRESIRRQVIHQFIDAKLVVKNPDDPSRPTNSGNTCYALTSDALALVRTFSTPEWLQKCSDFKRIHGTLSIRYKKKRTKGPISTILPNGTKLDFSPGKHNLLQVAVIEEFQNKFIQPSELLYVGDTDLKTLYIHEKKLKSIGISLSQHDKLPDLVYLWKKESKDVLILIEVVTSHGPVSEKRKIELEYTLKNCALERIYVTAFEDYNTFKKYVDEIAWDTEVWLREIPDHVIHFNGPNLKGP